MGERVFQSAINSVQMFTYIHIYMISGYIYSIKYLLKLKKNMDKITGF